MAARKQPRITYTPSQIEQMSARNIRQSLSRLRSVAQKRQARLIAAGYTDSEIATRPLPTVRSLTPEDQAVELADLSRILRDPRSTIKGVKEWTRHVRESLQRSGYSDIAARDLKAFGSFMDEMRDRYIGRLYGSSLVASLYNEAAAKGVSGKTLQREFKRYLESAEKVDELRKALEQADLRPGRKRITSNEIRGLLGVPTKPARKRGRK